MHIARVFALGVVSSVFLGGCFSNYSQDLSSGNVSTLHFAKSKDLAVGVTYFSAVSDPKCKTNLGRLATMGALHGDTQTTRVSAETRLFLVGQWLTGFGSGCHFIATAPPAVSMCINSCTVVGSFVPRSGSSYKVGMRVSSGECHLTVDDADAPGEPVRVSAYPLTDRCKKV